MKKILFLILKFFLHQMIKSLRLKTSIEISEEIKRIVSGNQNAKITIIALRVFNL